MFQSILSKQPRLNFIPFISVLFCRSERQSGQNVESLGFFRFFFGSNTCTHRGPIFSAKSKEAAHCGQFGALGTKKHKIKDGARKAMRRNRKA